MDAGVRRALVADRSRRCGTAPRGEQVALFLLDDDALYAVGNIDPFGRAAVMSRGLVGDRARRTDRRVTAAQAGLLTRRRALPRRRGAGLTVYDVRVVDGCVQIRSTEPLAGFTIGVTAARRADEFARCWSRGARR